MDFKISGTLNDSYSAAMEGFYYQSTSCKTCPEPLLAATAQVDKNEVCYGDEIQLNVTGASSYEWTSNPQGFISNLKNPKVKLLEKTRFYIRIYDADGCRFGLDSVTVNVLPKPQISPISNVSICLGSSVTIKPTLSIQTIPPYTYNWSPATGLDNPNSPIVTASPSATTIYTLTVTDAKGCSDQTNVTVTVNPLPIVNGGRDTSVNICLGTGINLNLTINLTTPPYTYQWSPSTGLNDPNSLIVNATPAITTKYTLNVTDGNGCIAQGNVTVIVNPLPTANAGRDTAVCLGKPITLNAKSGAGTPPFNYDWNPKTQITSGANTLAPTIVLNSTSDFYFTVTDVNGCKAVDTIRIKALNLNQPVITSDKSTRICSCDSVTLDAGNLGYINFKWNTGATTQKITVNTPGNYTVTVTDTNGCINTSAPINIQVINPSATVGFGSPLYQANSGDTVKIPFVIKSSTFLDTCHTFSYAGQIRFNKSLISPILTTPKGNKTTNERIIQFNGVRNPNDTVLTVFTFIATLGDSEQTNLTIDNFEWNDCSTSTNLVNSVFALTDLCNEGNITRLIKQGKSSAILEIKPNPLEKTGKISFLLGFDTQYSIYISDILGNKILTIDEGFNKLGKHEKYIDMTNLNSGTYIVILKTSTEIVSQLIQVSK
jgi:hypothetical protein